MNEQGTFTGREKNEQCQCHCHYHYHCHQIQQLKEHKNEKVLYLIRPFTQRS